MRQLIRLYSLSAPYLLAFTTVSAAALLRYSLQPYLGEQAPMLLFTLPVVICAMFSGVWSACLATILSMFAGVYFFIGVPGTLTVKDPADGVRLILFAFVAVSIIAIAVLLERSKAAQRNSEERYRLLVQGAHDVAVFFVTPDGKVGSWNEGAQRIKGYSEKEILGQHISRFYTTEDRQAGEPASFLKEATEKGSARCQGWRVRSNGKRFWADIMLTALHDNSGKLRGFSKITCDRTREHGLMKLLEESEQTAHALLESTAQAVIGIHPDGNIGLFNKTAEQMFGYAREDLIGQPLELLLPEELRIRHAGQRTDYFSHPRARPMGQGMELQARRCNGESFFIEASINICDTPAGRMAVSFVTDITKRKNIESDRKEAEQRALHAAQHDPLTDLPNRALIYEFGTHLLASAKRTQSKIAVLFFDLDRFKPVNDTYGHETGDRMLQEVAHRIKSSVRADDLVGRLGGDEFVAILTNMQDEESIHHAAQHLLATLRDPYQIGAHELRTSPSIGISRYPNDGDDIDTLIRHADVAMYHAKSNGRNTYQFFNTEFDTGENRAFTLEQRLRRSFHESEFEVFYQPVMDTRTMQVYGAEALIRWRQKGAEIIMPGDFIMAAEACGLINQLGTWVLEEACRQQVQWCEDGLPTLNVAVNVSPIQFRANDFEQRVAEAITKSGITPKCLELEVTESMVMREVQKTTDILAALKRLGIRISLDDFGTGYSSLSHLSRLPIDKLKIDQSFVRNIENDKGSLVITETVIGMGKKLGVEVVAEGIESEEALDLLRERDCDLGQGYYFGTPMPAHQFTDWYWRTHPAGLYH